MAQFVGPNVTSGSTSSVDTTALNTVGSRATDGDGNEYVYLPGVVGTVAGSWVSIGAANATALLATGAKGRVAIAMAASVASTWGWYQVRGTNSIALAGSNGTIVSGGGELKVAETASEGTARVVLATGDSFGATDAGHIYGAWSYSGQPDSDSAATGTPGADLIVVYLNNPFIAPLTASV